MIKGDRAKRQMLSQLLMNLQKISKDISNEIVLKKFFDKIELVTPLEFSSVLKEKLLQTPGIDQVLEAIQINEMDSLDKIKVEVNKYMSNEIIDKTFVIRAKRVGTQDFKSIVIEPKLSMQWFLKMEHMAQIALEPVMNDDIKFYPPKYKNT
jgi:thiamine biosynthesis protein ThiI